jgi:hypothetical protein
VYRYTATVAQVDSIKAPVIAPVISALEPRILQTAFNVCLQFHLAPLQQARKNRDLSEDIEDSDDTQTPAIR